MTGEALVVPLPARCFYCARPLAADGETVRGVAVVAHRACVHQHVVANLRTMYPSPPEVRGGGGFQPGPTARFLREAGVTPQELWG